LNSGDDGSDIDLYARVPLSGGAQIAHLLGRIEATLTEMRHDIQASVRAQECTNDRLERIDLRVLRLEDREAARTRFSRVAAAVAGLLLIPALTAVQQVHGWFDAVSDTCFPRKP
jgi:hypothetical protein